MPLTKKAVVVLEEENDRLSDENAELREQLDAARLALGVCVEALKSARPLIEDEWFGMDGPIGIGGEVIRQIDAALAAIDADQGREG